MTLIAASKAETRPQIDLRGPDGNAFAILGRVGTYGRQIGMDSKEITELLKDMKQGDYKNLVLCFEDAFGKYVDIILPENWND
jgi:hypothetical protein